jgi:anaerobic selenocysteine-containing dehydrogenase
MTRMTNLLSKGALDGWRRSVCPYCGTGCGLRIRAREGVVSDVQGDPHHLVNAGKLCAKGALLAPMLRTEDRLLFPLLRDRLTGATYRVSWDDAIARVAHTIRRVIATHGPDAVMLYGSGQLLTEDYYLFGKLAKGYLGTNNQDTNSRLCMASAVAAYQLAFGTDAPPASYADIEHANTFLIVGANVEACHPILFQRIRARKRAGKDRIKVIVVDPRATETAAIADLHLPIRPGTDVALLNALLYEVTLIGGLDERFIAAHTRGWEEVRAHLPRYQAELVADIVGLPAQLIVDAARMYATNGPALSLWSMGANQSTAGVDKNLALINLALATGNIGKPGAGPFSLTGQPNAMGGREAGGLAGALPGHRLVANARDRAEVEAFWGLPPGAISARPGLTAVEMVEALEQGHIKVLWIAGTNPLVSLPNAHRAREAFARAELVVVQDAYHPTETTQVADVILPAAQWSEREGTMTNGERRICLLEQAGDPPGEALPDWQIICRVAEALGFGRAFRYRCTEEVFREYRELTRGRDLDITGVDYALLRATGGVQWPCPEGARHGTTRLFTDGRFPTPDGRARFHAVDYRAPAEEVSAEYPLVLLTGRVKDQWHTRTRTGKVPKLNRSAPGPFVEIHEQDAQALGIRDGAIVRVVSRRGAVELPARLTCAIRPGTIFAPFHWGALWSERTVVNLTTNDAVDPASKEPELKFAAVRVEPV